MPEIVSRILPVLEAGPGRAIGQVIVYTSRNLTGKVQYVGITNNLARRAAEHAYKSGIQIQKLLAVASRSDARAVEQALIDMHGLGTLMNKINSVAHANPAYAAMLSRGYD